MSTCKHCNKCKNGCDFCSCCGRCQRCDNVQPVTPPAVNPFPWVPVPYPVYPQPWPTHPDLGPVITWYRSSTGVVPLTVGDGVIPLTFDRSAHDRVGCGGGLFQGETFTSTIGGYS